MQILEERIDKLEERLEEQIYKLTKHINQLEKIISCMSPQIINHTMENLINNRHFEKRETLFFHDICENVEKRVMCMDGSKDKEIEKNLGEILDKIKKIQYCNKETINIKYKSEQICIYFEAWRRNEIIYKKTDNKWYLDYLRCEKVYGRVRGIEIKCQTNTCVMKKWNPDISKEIPIIYHDNIKDLFVELNMMLDKHCN